MWPIIGHPTLTSLLTVCLLNPTLVSLLAFASVFDNLPANYRACNIKPVFKDSPFIKAFTEVAENGHGCFSNETVNGSEVHVVFLSNRFRINGEVYLEIITKNKRQSHPNPLIIILGSRKQVTWKVRLPNIDSGRGEHLIVTYLRSTVKFIKKLDYVDISKYGNFPTRAKKLLKWVSNKYQVITSYTRFHSRSRHLRLQVGINSKAPPQCILRKNAEMPYASTISYNSIPFGGCAVTTNQHYSFSPKHIIEVSGARKSPLNEIIIELRPYNVKNPNVRITLVLKASDDNVVWVIRSRKIMGSLDIYSNNGVKTEHVMMQRVAQNREKLYESGHKLVNWVGEHTYGYISSYTNVSRVDKITLSVEGTTLDQSFKPDKPKKTKPEIGDPSLVSPFANPVKTKAALQAAMQTSCFPDGLVVHINRSLTKMYGLKHDQITLDDPICRAEKINNYFVLRSSYSDCQTIPHKSSPLKYSNKLKIHHARISQPLQPLQPSKVTQFEGSGIRNDASDGTDDDDDDNYEKKQGSGSGYLLPLDDTHMDDEDYRFQNIMIDFSCSPSKKISPNLKYHLDFYDDPFYSNLYDSSPFYTTKEKYIYVKARVSGDLHYGVQVLNCALTEYGRSIQPLLDKGCPSLHSGLKWQLNNQLGTEYFSFRVNPHVAEGTEHHLSCTVITCAKDITLETGTWKTRQCIAPKEFCSAYDEHNSFVGVQLVKVISEGSFIVHSGKSLSRNKNNRLPSKTSIKQVTVQGLESGTVIGIAFSAFIIGVLLTATLWFIQVYTDPQKREAKRRIEGSTTETSADSTPCSFSPISM
ncbi:transforming growth factor beta receptor type 3-like [Octopus sinensis]|uniref:Transforming growth factor beta receptor type 3-like n=1 Tax=Octopus sinensis TaxID=2607531 RepID=A0A7E6EZ67_9MOLL|nr:transforming growth factor beta receptor type 3-like [Octopus sinensis]